MNTEIKIYSVNDEKGFFNKLVIGDKSIYFQIIDGQLDTENLTDDDIEIVESGLKYKQQKYRKTFNLIKDKYGLILNLAQIQEIQESLIEIPQV